MFGWERNERKMEANQRCRASTPRAPAICHLPTSQTCLFSDETISFKHYCGRKYAQQSSNCQSTSHKFYALHIYMYTSVYWLCGAKEQREYHTGVCENRFTTHIYTYLRRKSSRVRLFWYFVVQWLNDSSPPEELHTRLGTHRSGTSTSDILTLGRQVSRKQRRNERAIRITQ